MEPVTAQVIITFRFIVPTLCSRPFAGEQLHGTILKNYTYKLNLGFSAADPTHCLAGRFAAWPGSAIATEKAFLLALQQTVSATDIAQRSYGVSAQ
jgi:hypothetical protein